MADLETGQGKTCFIVGPIGDRLEPPGTEGRLRYENATQMWENVFEPACATFGMTPVRADKISESGEIPEQIFTYLRDADVVIADLTGGNANVMYELGLRHTRDKVTIQIGEHERLPFDVNTIRTVKFRRTEAGLIDARNSLVEALRSALAGDGTAVTATRVWNELSTLDPAQVAEAAARSLTSDDPADSVEDDGPGRLDLLATGEMSMEAIGAIFDEFTALSHEMTAVLTDTTPIMEEAESFKSKLTVIKQLADSLRPIADKFDESSSEYLNRVEDVDAMMNVIIKDFADDEDVDVEQSAEFFEGLVTLTHATDGMSISLTGALHQAREMRKWSNILRSVSKSFEHSFNTILRGNLIIGTWIDKFRELPGWVEPELDLDDDTSETDTDSQD